MSEKSDTQPTTTPTEATPSGPSESEILSAINPDHKQPVESASTLGDETGFPRYEIDHVEKIPLSRETITYLKNAIQYKDFIIPAKIYTPHLELLHQGVHPRDIPSISYGFQRGCQSLKNKLRRGEMLVKNGSAVVSSSAVENPEETAIDEIIDAEVAGMIADIPRNIGELLANQKISGHEKELQRIWERTDKEQNILNKMAKRVWDAEAKLPDFKHKEAWILGIFEGTKLSVRITATIALIKSMKVQK